jgi:hypothetical protein
MRKRRRVGGSLSQDRPPISQATGRLNTVPDSLYQIAEVFFA